MHWMDLFCWWLAVSPFLFGFFWSGCPCCAPVCLILEDHFDGNGTDMGANWTEVAGAWSRNGGVAEIASANALMIATPVEDELKITCTVLTATSGDKARIIFNYQDSSNYHCAEIKFGAGGWLKIIAVVAGTPSDVESESKAFPTATLVTWSLCIGGPYIGSSNCISNATWASGGAYIGTNVTPTNTGFGLGTGDTCAGTMKFDDFIARVAATTCSTCTVCTNCPDGVGPFEFQVDIAGITNNFCMFCTSLNATYIMEGAAGGCTWTYPALTVCSLTAIQVQIPKNAGIYTVEVWIGTTTKQSRWIKDYSTTMPDCNFSSVSLPYSTSTGVNCTWSASTCTITTL